MAKRLMNWLIGRINNCAVKKKLYILYFFCMLIPLLITDGAILATIIGADSASEKQRLENIGSAVKYSINTTIENAASISKNIYVNAYINDFLENSYPSPLEYYNSYLDFMRGSLFKSSMGNGIVKITMYADNDTLINGGEFARLETANGSEWYREFKDSVADMRLYVSYDGSRHTGEGERRISLIRPLDFFKKRGCEKVLKLDLDYNRMARDLEQMKYAAPIYICADGKILFSNTVPTQIAKTYETFDEEQKAAVTEIIKSYGAEWKIYVMKPEKNTWSQFRKFLPMILFLVFLNIIIPWLFMQILNRSFTQRLWELSQVFDGVEDERLREITNIRGTDELGDLMRNYNNMAKRINELIETVYIERLKEQEADISRQNAELLALHSQINPHFLFNALESIRMHSILKKELETAHIIEQLALMQRQYVDWGTDLVKIKSEMEFVEAYLELQKYRFGRRLSYSLDMEEACGDCLISKLTLVTFVENACVHGIEDKPAGGWIFVRVFCRDDELYLEVEDTGRGMGDKEVELLRLKMEQAKIGDLKEKGRVGIINACLRLKIMTENMVRFELESEEGVGTMVTVRLPIKYVLSYWGLKGE